MAIDDEVRRILEEAYAHAREIIEANNDKINAMADLLLEKETIYAEDIETILGPSAQSQKEAKEKNAAKKADTAVEITDEPSVSEPIVAPATENNTDSKN
jgi:cell division protease FtsH